MTIPSLLVWLGISTAMALEPTPSLEALLQRGALSEALLAASEVARARPADLEAQELYVDILLSLGQTARAEHEMRERTRRAPDNPDAHYLVGRAVVDGMASQIAFEAALRLRPDHARAHMGMAAVHLARGRSEEALAGYERALRFDGTLGEAWLGRIRALMILGRTGEATTVAREGIAAVPAEPGLVLVLAQLAPLEAETLLRAGATRSSDPRLPEALSTLLLEKGDAAGALAAAQQALAVDPSLPDAGRTELFAREIQEGRLDVAGRSALVEVRTLEVGDPKAALAKYPALQAAYPKSSLVLLGRGAARQALGDAAGALEDLVVAVTLDPKNIEALAAAGMALQHAGRNAEAERLLGAATFSRPWDATLGLARARAMGGLGRLDEAGGLLRELAVVHRYDPEVQLAFADHLVREGQFEVAYAVLKTSMMLVPDPRIAVAFIRVAPAAGRPEEAAALLDVVVAQTGNAALAEAARQLRAGIAPK